MLVFMPRQEDIEVTCDLLSGKAVIARDVLIQGVAYRGRGGRHAGLHARTGRY